MAKTTPIPTVRTLIVNFPTPQILLIILNRPKALNAIDTAGHWELHDLLEWYDTQPSLRCAIITGRGRAFCAGADLKEWDTSNQSSDAQSDRMSKVFPSSGFGGVSRRTGKKPIILAINGIAFGGGMEMVSNADIAIASVRARFALPEVKRGVVAIAGALPRLIRSVGRARAMEMGLTGRILSAPEAERWGIVSQLVDDRDEKEQDSSANNDNAAVSSMILNRKLTQKALAIAKEIASNSPDAVIVTKAGINLGWEGIGAEEGSRLLVEQYGRKLNEGENLREGVKAFIEKREPKWRDSKL